MQMVASEFSSIDVSCYFGGSCRNNGLWIKEAGFQGVTDGHAEYLHIFPGVMTVSLNFASVQGDSSGSNEQDAGR